jgi:hypothetical protein
MLSVKTLLLLLLLLLFKVGEMNAVVCHFRGKRKTVEHFISQETAARP